MIAVTFNIISGFIKATVPHAGYYARRVKHDAWQAYAHSKTPISGYRCLKTTALNQRLLQ